MPLNTGTITAVLADIALTFHGDGIGFGLM
jgi:hypothetical protein